ncbi:Uncharacterised protein [uncultured archaeon]|nr:Uncharacterised protein [uncultured archaeon]
MSWIDKLEYKELIKDLTPEQKKLIKYYFDDLESGSDGDDATIYHIETREDLERIKQRMRDDCEKPEQLEAVFKVLENNIKTKTIKRKKYDVGFDFVLQG